MGNFEAAITNTDCFLVKFRKNVAEIWNDIDDELVRNLYEKYTNHLLDVKRAKCVTRHY